MARIENKFCFLKNLNWIGRTNDLIEKLEVEEEDIGGESENDDDNDDNNGEQLNKKQRNKRSLYDRGMRKEWRDNDTTTTTDERQLR